jgi:hypothetical protein
MIDQGFCFNAGEWNFPDAPLRGLYARHRVYESVCGLESFEPWLARMETKTNKAFFDGVIGEIPPEWYGFESAALEQMIERLLRRRKLVRELIVSAWKSSAQPFPNWKWRMPEENNTMFRYRVLRYMRNLIRDEWLNIGILLEEAPPAAVPSSSRRAFRVIEGDTDFARIRRLHLGADASPAAVQRARCKNRL